MAQIPTYGGQAVHENVNLGAPMQQLNAPVAAFGSDGKGLIQAGEGLQKGAAVLAAITSEMNKEKDQRDAAAALISAQKDINDYSARVYSSAGAGLEGATRNFEMFRDSRREQALGELKSPRAQAMFTEKFEPHIETVRGAIASHEAKGLATANIGAQVALADTARNLAEANYTNANIVNSNIEQVSSATAEAGRLAGKSSTEIGNMVANKVSETLGQVAKRFIIDRNFDAAKGILADPRLMGDEQKIISGQLKEEALKGQALELAASWRGMSRPAVYDTRKNAPDQGLWEKAYNIFMANDAADRNARALYVQDSIVKATDKIDQLSNDPIGLQSYLDSLPRGNADQLRIYQHAQALGRNIITAQTGATGRFTDPASYAGMVNDTGPGGKKAYASEQEVIADPRMANIDAPDRKRIVESWKGATKVDEHELMRQYKLAAGYANGDDPQAKLTPDEQADFMRFSEYTRGMTQDTKQGKDPDYLKKMALRWKLQGETKEWYAPGRGTDRTFGDVLKMPVEKRNEWAPDLPAEGSTDRQLLDAKFSQPGVVDSLKKAYKTTDGEEAKRLYYRDLLFKTVPMMPSKRIGKGS